MKNTIFGIAFFGLSAFSVPLFAQDVIPANEAFKVSHIVNSEKFLVNFQVADGYQLYKDTIALSDNVSASLTGLPEGVNAFDEFKGDVVYLNGSFQVSGQINDVKGKSFYIKYQGCKPDMFCYPPQKHEINLP